MEISNINESIVPKIWLYKKNEHKFECTKSEKKIAESLTPKKSKMFLESRGLLRKSLSNLFDIDPLKIEVFAKPNKPIMLPDKMGYVSMSHSDDALLLAWNKTRVGIDIERHDRNFNYKELARKYFLKIDEINYRNLNRIEVLNRWTAKEASIKWDEGSIAKDLINWKYDKKKQITLHKQKKIKLDVRQFYFLKWTISIALVKVKKNYYPTICY